MYGIEPPITEGSEMFCLVSRSANVYLTAYELPLLSNNIATKQVYANLAWCGVDRILIVGAPAWPWLGEYATLDRTFYEGAVISLSRTRKETSYSDQTLDLFSILLTKLNTLLSSSLQRLQATKKKKKKKKKNPHTHTHTQIKKFVRPTRSPRQRKSGDISIVFSVRARSGE
jgi:hypothetical protein